MMRPNRSSTLLLRLWPWLTLVDRRSLRSDLLAGLTGAVIVLPQGVAFAMLAGLPPEYGLYTAMVTPIVAALFVTVWEIYGVAFKDVLPAGRGFPVTGSADEEPDDIQGDAPVE